MALKIIKRALLLFLGLSCITVAAVGLVVWHHMHIANPCLSDGLINGESATCFYRVQPTGDWLSAVSMLAGGLALSLLASWLSFKLGRPAAEA